MKRKNRMKKNGFKRRPVIGSQTLGERLLQLRTEAGLTIDQVSQHLGISRKHVQSIEAGDYGKMPGEIYIKNFLRSYAGLLNVQEAAVLKKFQEEYNINRRINPRIRKEELPPEGLPKKFVFTPVAIKRIIIGLLVVSILVYLGWEVSKIISPPSLILSEPPESYTTNENLVVVAGETEPEAIVLINKEQIFVGKDGSFRETLVMEPGVNTVIIEAKKPRSRTITIYRQLLYEIN
ncbi:helix-turn-helix domain-containing protein [Patescibacteria group bacterium]